MTTISAARDVEAYLTHVDEKTAQIQQQIEQAQAGQRAVLSREAAAFYLGMSTKTLFRLIQSGDGPPYQKSQGTSRSSNERVYFPFDALRTWHEARTQYSSPALRAALEEEAQRNALRQRLAALDAEAASLRKALRESGDRRVMGFDSLSSITCDQPWVFDGDTVLGHALTVSDIELSEGEIVSMPMEEALLEGWRDMDKLEHFTEIYVAVLEHGKQLVQSNLRRQKMMAIAEAAAQR